MKSKQKLLYCIPSGVVTRYGLRINLLLVRNYYFCFTKRNNTSHLSRHKSPQEGLNAFFFIYLFCKL